MNHPRLVVTGAWVFLCAWAFWTSPAAAQVVSLSTTTMPFGNVAVGSTSTRNLKIINAGTSNLIITSIAITGNFQSSNCASSTLTPNGTCTVSVSFTPPTTGSFTGTLSITDNASNSPQVVSLSGSGVPAVTFSPASLTFPNQAVGTASAPKTLTLVNNQSVSLTITSVTTTGNFTAGSCPATLAAQATCVISVTFTPSVLGTNTGTLTVTDSANNSPQTASLTGSGVQPVTFSLSAISFGNQAANTTSAPKTVTLTNNQSVPLNISSISATPASFAASSCATPIAPNGTCVISVTFTPSATGSYTGTLTVADDANTSPQTVTLSGTGVLSVSLAPTVLQFPSQVVGTTSKPASASLSNSQSTALTVTSVTTTGPFAATPCPASIPPSGSCTISVTFTPLAAGQVSGTLSVADSATSSPQTATLQGVGAAVQLISIAVAPANPSIAAGTTQPFTATGTYNNGTSVPLGTVTWSSSATNVATITATGLASALAKGTTTITATSGTVSGSAALTVTPPALVSITVAPANATITSTGTQQYAATGAYSDGSTQNLTGSVSWASTNSGVATISPAGLAAGVAAGAVTISAVSGSIVGTTTLTVGNPPTLVSIAITPTSVSIPLSTSQGLTATGTYSDGSVQTLTGTAVTWSVNGVVGGNATLGTISGLGLYAAPATLPNPALLTITATSTADGITSANATVTVIAAITVTVAPSTTQTVLLNHTQQFSATVTGTTNTNVTWSVNGIVGGNAIIGTVSSSGLYTAPPLVPYPDLQSVTATSVADPTKTASGTARPSPSPNAVVVTISPVNSWVQIGNTWQFFAKILGTGNQAVTWSVNGVVGGNSTYGTINTGGLYAAPSVVPVPSQVVVTVTSAADLTKSASGAVIIGTSPFGAMPLVDFSPGELYLGQFSGYLYNGGNSPPSDHDAAGLAAAAAVQPLDAYGNPSPTGQIVLTSVGMSEAQDDWCFSLTVCTSYSFMGQAAASRAVNHTTLTIVEGATSGANVTEYTCAYGNCPSDSSYSNKYDWFRDTVLTPAGLTEAQVQVVWVQEADTTPTWAPSLPSSSADAYNFEYQLGQLVRALKVRWPNVKQVFFSSRIYAGYATTDESPEPYSYEYGYSVKWLINAQIVQRETGATDPLAGDLLTAAPWVAWSAYLWGNDSNNIPGSLAINWTTADYATNDYTHPNPRGVPKTAGALMNFFLTSPYTPWFRN